MRRVFVSVVGVCALAQAAGAQEWAQWRGPSRDGAVPAASVPREWPASLERAWRVEIGEGFSSPVLANGRVFVHSRRDPEEIVTAIGARDGAIIWQQKYPAPFTKNQYAVRMAKGPNSTPLVAGGRLYTIGATGVLSAWSTDTGALVWRNDYSTSVDTSKLFCGTSVSPMIEGGLLVVQVGSDVHGGRVIALDPATGKERWTWKGLGPGYASPIAVATGGMRQIVSLTEGSIVGIDAKTGASLWSVPFPDDWHENIMTPVWTGTHLVVSGTRQGTHAFTLQKEGAAWRAVPAWKNPDVAIYMSTPVVADGTLYAHSNRRKGQFVAFDGKTGAVRWATDGREGEHASVLLTPTHVLFLTNASQLVVTPRAAARFEVAKRYTVADSETWAVPVLLPDGLIVRDATGLARLMAGT